MTRTCATAIVVQNIAVIEMRDIFMGRFGIYLRVEF